MRTAYYLEVKHFLANKKGGIEQIFDIGEMPKIYCSYDKALTKAANMVTTMECLQGQNIDEDTSEFDEDLPTALYRRKLVIPNTYYYTYISIYEITIC